MYKPGTLLIRTKTALDGTYLHIGDVIEYVGPRDNGTCAVIVKESKNPNLIGNNYWVSLSTLKPIQLLKRKHNGV